jgi:tetratricopeptide (TPR) repeat protein
MYCPDCGYDAGEANFCPECGSDLGALKNARKNVKTTGNQRRSGGGRAAGDVGAVAARPVPQARAKGGLSTAATIWILVAIAAAAAFAIVYIVNNRGSSSSASTPTAPSTPVSADTSGTYSELVARANNLYDQGGTYVKENDFAGAAPYFAAAAKVYAAAWKKQPGDTAVGTDYATSLFYAGDTEGAIKQVNKVLAKDPTFQNALYNRGNFLAMQGRVAEQNGQKAKADKLYAQAKASYQAAIKVDPTSDSGQAATQALKSL